MTFAIKVEHLSKCYRIQHGAPAGSLKELVEHYRRKFFSKILPKKQDSEPDHDRCRGLRRLPDARHLARRLD